MPITTNADAAVLHHAVRLMELIQSLLELVYRSNFTTGGTLSHVVKDVVHKSCQVSDLLTDCMSSWPTLKRDALVVARDDILKFGSGGDDNISPRDDLIKTAPREVSEERIAEVFVRTQQLTDLLREIRA